MKLDVSCNEMGVFFSCGVNDKSNDWIKWVIGIPPQDMHFYGTLITWKDLGTHSLPLIHPIRIDF